MADIPITPQGDDVVSRWIKAAHRALFLGGDCCLKIQQTPGVRVHRGPNGQSMFIQPAQQQSAAPAVAQSFLVLQFLYQFGDYIGAQDASGKIYAVAKPQGIRCSMAIDLFGSYVYGTDFQSRIATPNVQYDSLQRTETQVVSPEYIAGLSGFAGNGTPTEILAVSVAEGIAQGMAAGTVFQNTKGWSVATDAPAIVTDPTDANFPAGTLVTLLQIGPGNQAWTKIS